MGYKDIREYLARLEEKGLLKHVKKEVDRDWEISAVCRNYFYTTSSEDRPALMFDSVKGFPGPVVAAICGGSKKVYFEALGMEPSDNMMAAVSQKWADCTANPVEPVMVAEGPVHEVVKTGEEVDVFQFPHPIWSSGLDPGYFLTAPCVISKNPKTGVRNVGTYRCQLKAKNRTGLMLSAKHRGLQQHLDAAAELGLKKLELAIVIGAQPSIPLCSVSGIPTEVDELGVAGALNGAPVELVKCKTVDLEVPATAEIVFEGYINIGELEEEGPFGEYTGYLSGHSPKPPIHITAVTHRKDPIYHCYLSQRSPSESSCIRGFGRESAIIAHLRQKVKLPVKDVCLTESGGASAMIFISADNLSPGQFWQYVWAVWSIEPALGKFTVVVDGDINIRDAFEREWAMSFRVRPSRDIHIVNQTYSVPLDPAIPRLPTGEKDTSSKVVIDATKKGNYNPVALPPQEHFEKVRAVWQEYGLSD